VAIGGGCALGNTTSSSFLATMSKAGKNTGLSQKNSFFLRKNGADVFVLFFSPFSPGRCAEPVKGVFGEILRLQRKVSRIFSEFSPLFLSVPKVLGS
jgi:hypothetical protein